MRIIWNITAADGTHAQSFFNNTNESIEDINITGISYAFYSDTNWTTPVAAPSAGTMTWTGQQYYPNGVVLPIPVAISGSSTTNVVNFATAGSSYGFTFSGKCMALSVVNSGISGSVGSIQIIIDRYTG